MSQQTDWKFDEFFVWIHNHHKQIIGAGFLVGKREIATCAHVVRVALGLNSTPLNAPNGDVSLSFPFFTQDRLLATVLAEGWDQKKDIALLRLNDDLPKGTQPAKLSAAKTLENHSFRVYGFPGKTVKGVWTHGTIKDRRENGQVQLESATGYAVQEGFSGGPVFDDDLKKVVGMIVTSDESVRVASMIPVDMLFSVCCRAGVNLELGKKDESRAMNISPRAICENCLKESFTARDKEEFISLCMGYIPDAGRKLDDMRSIDWMFNRLVPF